MKVIGSKVSISLGEPWDFPHNPIEAIVRKSHTTILSSEQGDKLEERVMFQATKPFGYQNLKSEYFIASPRYVGERISDLLSKGKLTIAMHRISEETAKSENPFEVKNSFGTPQSWGGIGTIRMNP